MPDRPVFYFDYSSPYAYLAAMRIGEVLPDATWRPIAFGILIRRIGKVPWSLRPGREAGMREIEERAAARGLPPVRWPDGWPDRSYSLLPLRAAVVAESHGRLERFSAEAYRLMFAEGRTLDRPGPVLDAAEAAGLDRDAMAARLENPAIKGGCGPTRTTRSRAGSPACRRSPSAALCSGATTCSRAPRPPSSDGRGPAFASVVVVTATITVTHISDPGCPWAWSAAPHHAVLHWRYGGQLAWRLALIGLAESAEDYTARGYTPASGALGYVNFRRLGMPFDTQPRERTIGTGRACRAIVAARLIDPDAELPAFRALQLARFTTTALFDTDDAIRAALARVPRLDADAVLAAIDDPATEAAYQADRALVRTASGSPTEFQGKAANTDGAVRYTAPSLIFEHRDGSRLEAGGFQPVEAYDVVIANLDPTLARRPPADDVAEAIAAFQYALTTREVAALMAAHLEPPDDRAAERALIEAAAAGRVRRETIGGGALWHLT